MSKQNATILRKVWIPPCQPDVCLEPSLEDWVHAGENHCDQQEGFREC